MSELPFPRPMPLDRSAWQDGAALPAWGVPVTTTLVVAGALASRDFYAGHHDRDAAVAGGSPDVFMNIMTTAGLVGRYLTDLAGSDCAITDLDLRLGAPNQPADYMELTGEVVRSTIGASGSLVAEIAFRGTNSRGAHAHGTATIDLPAAPQESVADREPAVGVGGPPPPRDPHTSGPRQDNPPRGGDP